MIRRWSLAAVAAVVATVGLAPAATADPVGATSWMSRTWGVDGRVSELVPTSAGVVVGGSFTTAVAPSGASRPARSIALWDPESGRFADWPVAVAGEVLAAAVDGDTLYLGGDFTTVNGAARRNLAAVRLSTGTLLPWSPRAFGQVETLAVRNGSIYAGGVFTQVEDATAITTTNRIARLGADGSLDRTWTGSIAAGDRVRVLLLTADGGGLYIGGDFTELGGSSVYGRLARVGTGATATIDTTFRSGNNNNNGRSPVFDLALVGSSLLVASGGGGGGCTRQDAATGRTTWSHHGTGDVVAVSALGPFAYCGGHFSGVDSFAGLERNKVAEVSLSTGGVTDWAPRVNSAMGIWTMASTASALVVGGDFTRSSGTYQPHLGQFRDLSSLTPPSVPLDVRAVPGDGQVTLQWGEPDTDGGAQVGRYLVLRANAAGAFTQVGNTASTSFTQTGLTNGTAYQLLGAGVVLRGRRTCVRPGDRHPRGGARVPAHRAALLRRLRWFQRPVVLAGAGLRRWLAGDGLLDLPQSGRRQREPPPADRCRSPVRRGPNLRAARDLHLSRGSGQRRRCRCPHRCDLGRRQHRSACHTRADGVRRTRCRREPVVDDLIARRRTADQVHRPS